MKRSIVLALLVGMFLSSCATLNKLGIQPTALETINALRTVLNSSTFRTIAKLKKLNDRGIEGVLPSELKPVLKTLETLGLGKEISTVSKQIGQASEIALTETKETITDAIKTLNFGDAVSVVIGGESAATAVLKNAMYQSVKKRYAAKIENELSKTEVLNYWPMAVQAYNLFAKDKVNSSLPDFLAERAVDAMFLAMGKEEKAIRNDYKALGNQIVNKVFDYYLKSKT